MLGCRRLTRRRLSITLFKEMSGDITIWQNQLQSKSKQKRLEAIAKILVHPDAASIDLAKCLCSEDNRNFEFQSIPGLSEAMWKSWDRIRGSDHSGTFRYLSRLHRSSPIDHSMIIIHVLTCIATPRAVDMALKLREKTPEHLLYGYNSGLRTLQMRVFAENKNPRRLP